MKPRWEDIQQYLIDDTGLTLATVKTQRHLYGKVVALRIAQDDHMEEEVALVLPQQKGVEILPSRQNTHSVGVYVNDPDGNGLAVYYEEPGGYRRGWEGQYSSRLEEVTARASHV